METLFSNDHPPYDCRARPQIEVIDRGTMPPGRRTSAISIILADGALIAGALLNPEAAPREPVSHTQIGTVPRSHKRHTSTSHQGLPFDDMRCKNVERGMNLLCLGCHLQGEIGEGYFDSGWSVAPNPKCINTLNASNMRVHVD